MGWVGNNSRINSAFFSRHLVEQNVPNLIFGCYILNIPVAISSILGLGRKKSMVSLSVRKINSGSTTAGTASKIQCLNSIQISKNFKKIFKNKIGQLVFKPWLFTEIRVSKHPWFAHGFSKNFPPHEFPPLWFWIFGEAALAADKNQDWTPRPNLPVAWRQPGKLFFGLVSKLL